MNGLLRPYLPAFAIVVVLQVIGAVAGLAPLFWELATAGR
jgi:ATP-binding cassette subfamily B protein IrtA